MYALNYKNGNSVINYDITNDSTSTVNKNALNSKGEVLLKSDRKQTLGTGIPSGLVVVVSADGTVKGLTSTGGNIINVETVKGGTVIPMYWRQK
jgi:type IV pilus assembly protein PilY1